MAITKLDISITLNGIIKEKQHQITLTRHKRMDQREKDAHIYNLGLEVSVLRRTLMILDEVMPEQIGISGEVEEKIIEHVAG